MSCLIDFVLDTLVGNHLRQHQIQGKGEPTQKGTEWLCHNSWWMRQVTVTNGDLVDQSSMSLGWGVPGTAQSGGGDNLHECRAISLYPIGKLPHVSRDK